MELVSLSQVLIQMALIFLKPAQVEIIMNMR